MAWPGIECLGKAVSEFRRVYKDEFTYAICYNDMPHHKVRALRNFGIPVINKADYVHELPFKPSGPLWTLIPTRLNPLGYEICMDNDIIIYDRLPQIDEWLKQDAVIYTLSFHIDDKPCNYAQFDRFVKKGRCINTGFFGLPPKVDLRKHIHDLIKKIGQFKPHHHSFQGIVAALLSHYPKQIQINKKAINICRSERTTLRFFMGKYGTHFIHINYKNHNGWKLYKADEEFDVGELTDNSWDFLTQTAYIQSEGSDRIIHFDI